jgi:tRNA A-37 threonylcarbamoyl transferase component Bud32/tetratricopeptide (TPR) repeat protein/anti-anti-sigma regulatory factor
MPTPRSSLPPAQPLAAETDAEFLSDPVRIAARYEVEAVLGKGGLATVYRALDTATGQRVALKQLTYTEQEHDRVAREALFEREYRTLAELSHPRVIAVFDYGVDRGQPYYTMELLDGGDLKEMSPLPWREACRVMFDVCSSLALLHSRRLLHRDVSPRNVRYTSSGHAKLIDFGAMSPMGYSRQIVGTPAFVAPEVVYRVALDARADLFSAGATLYYALTRRLPYAARDFAQAAEAWRHKPAPPSHTAPDVPSALDSLVLALLSPDASKRPRTIHEVMERLAALAGLSASEPLSVSHAYFAAPSLVGRSHALAELDAKWAAALDGRGSAVLIRAEPGEGRSRMLDACALSAKTAGGTVLRVNVRPVAGRELGVSQALVDALFEEAPQIARAALPPDSELQPLVAATPRPRLRDLAVSRAALQTALREWLLALSAHRPVVLACDDVHEADATSLAVLATLATHARSRRFLLVLTAESAAIDASAAEGGMAVVAQQCSPLVLSPLAPVETEELLRSVFGEVPNLPLLSARVHERTGGNPRDCMDVIEHLAGTGQLAYERGQWTLPSELASLALPASAAAAVATRLAVLRPLARRLIEAQALATHAAFTREDYAHLVLRPRDVDGRIADRSRGSHQDHAGGGLEPQAHSDVESALVELLAEGLLEGDGASFVLRRRAFASTIASQLSEADRRARHTSLAQVYAHKQNDIVAAKHAFLGTDPAQGVECLIRFTRQTDDTAGRIQRAGMTPDEVAEVIEQGLGFARAARRTPYELAELEHWLVMLGTSADDHFYHGFAQRWFADIERDSGLARWRELSDVADAGDRLTRALVFASQHYQALPEAERVYSPQLAIQFLVHYVAASLAIGVRSHDGQLIGSLPGILAPYAPLSPLIHAVWKNAEATHEVMTACRIESARARYLDALSRLPEVTSDVPTQYVRNAVVFALGLLEARLGISSADKWVQQLDLQHGAAAVDAMYLRKILRLSEGDFQAAEQCRRQAELLALQENARPMLAASLIVELATHVAADDLTGVKHVKERIAALATRYPGWKSFAHLAQGQYLRLCGYAEEAAAELEQAVALSRHDAREPGRVITAWPASVAAYIDVLCALGRVADALRCGEQALAKCAELGSSIAAHGISGAYALALARNGEIAAASARLDALIAEQHTLGVHGLQLGASYEARTRVAIWAGDRAQIDHFGQLAAAEYRRGTGAGLSARYERLMEEAGRVGVPSLPSLTEVRSTLHATTATREPPAARVVRELSTLATRDARVKCALRRLCEAQAAERAALYLRAPSGIGLAESIGQPPLPPGFEASVEAALQRELGEDDTATQFEEPSTQAAQETAIETGPQVRMLPLRWRSKGKPHCAGLFVWVVDALVVPEPDWQLLAAIAEQLTLRGDCVA